MAFLTLLRKRLLGLLLVVFGVSLITFTISHLIPGDPARLIAGDRASDALVAGIRHQLGLDLPLYQQAQKTVLNDSAYVYLYQKSYTLPMRDSVKGYVFNPMLEQVFNLGSMSK